MGNSYMDDGGFAPYNSRDDQDRNAMLQFEGEIIVSTAKAFRFLADVWQNPEWIPKSQCNIVEFDESTKRCTLQIKAWLCNKNGWTET